eukprot:6483227-Amphidinium_carterae.1
MCRVHQSLHPSRKPLALVAIWRRKNSWSTGLRSMADESSGSSTELDDEEEDHESFDAKMKRLTKLGKEGKIDDLVKEANLAECTPEMIAFAAQKSKELGN